MEISELEKACVRLDQEERAAEAMMRARARLIMCKPAQRGAGNRPPSDASATVFLATLSLRLKMEASWSLGTMATDGERLLYNPEFTLSLPEEERLGVLCHEVLHCALSHPSRQGAREPEMWNVACDLATNYVLDEARIPLPAGALRAGRGEHAGLAPGLSAEEYYALLQQDQSPVWDEEDGEGDGESGEGEGQGPPDPGRCGAVQPPEGGPAAGKEMINVWQAAVAQAAQAAKQRGALPGGMARLVEEITDPVVPWREVLREFVSRRAKSDYSWSRPNRRLLSQGLYLPGPDGEELGEVVVAVDTSGSVGPGELCTFAAEMEGILQAFASCSLVIVYHDAQVQHVQRWSPCDGPLKLEPKGGGGTAHAPVFAWVEENAPEAPCLVCLTDCWTSYPAHAPAVPTLWAVVGNKNARPPFGAVIHVEA